MAIMINGYERGLMERTIRLLAAAAVPLLLAAGCSQISSIRIATPSDGTVLASPVTTSIELSELGYVPNSLSVKLEQQSGIAFSLVREVTADFSTPARLSQNVLRSNGVISVMTPGTYRITANACWRWNYPGVFVRDPGPEFEKLTSACKQALASITIVRPEIQLSATSLQLTAGVPATLGVTLVPPPLNPQTVTLTAPLLQSTTLTIPGGKTTATTATLQPSSLGSASLMVSAPAPYGTKSIPITVRQPAPNPFTNPFILYRSHATGIEVISFTPGPQTGTFALLPGGINSSVSPGLMVVGLEHRGTELVRASSGSIEQFTIGGTPVSPVLALAARSPATGAGSPALSGVGASIATEPGGPYVRGTDRGLEVWTPNTSPLSRVGATLNMAGTSSTGVAVIVDGQSALRSTSSTLELWSLAAAGNPALVPGFTRGTTPGGTNTQVFSAPVGTGLAWIIKGSFAVRSWESGIEIIEVSPSGTVRPPNVSNNRGGTVNFSVVGVATSAGGRVAVRATGNGLEIYSLSSLGARPVLCGVSREGDTSPGGGVAVATSGPLVFRATSSSIEAYSLSGFTCPATDNLNAITLNPAILRNGLALASTGLGLAWTINLP